MDEEKRAARYARISKDTAGDEHGVANQLADQERLAAAYKYRIVMTETDNNIGALTGKHRPGYQAVMAAAKRGELDVILVFQTSRLWCNRRERAEGIEILRKGGVSVIATRGPSLDMSTAYGRGMAGLIGEFDTMEREVKGERQQLANKADAAAGKPRRASPRPFGWLPDRMTADPAEAAAVAAGCRMLLSGGTVTGVARDWDARGLHPTQAPGSSWSRAAVRWILSNPRIAGISVYQGAEAGPGQWEPLVPEHTWRAVTEVLGDKDRRMNWGGTTLLGGIGYCRCGNYLTGGRSANGRPSYRCRQDKRGERPGPHVGIIRADVDAHIGLAVTARLAMPDAVHLLTPADGAEVAALRDEETALRARLARLGALFADDAISEADLVGGRRRGEARLAEITGRLAGLGRTDALAPLITAGDVAAAWEAMPIATRRLVVDSLMTVTLYPSGRGARRFDPEKVLPCGRGIVWKQ